MFLAHMRVEFPPTIDPEVKADLVAREQEYSGGLQRAGVMKGIWRVVGEYANYCVLDVADNDELHNVLSGFPMFAYLTIKVTPLAVHPNAVTDNFFAQPAGD